VNTSRVTTNEPDYQPENQLCEAIVNIMQAVLLLRRASARNLCAPKASLLRSVSDELRELTQPLLRMTEEMKAAEQDPSHIGSVAARYMAEWAVDLKARGAL
jgi:hypothetical protein